MAGATVGSGTTDATQTSRHMGDTLTRSEVAERKGGAMTQPPGDDDEDKEDRAAILSQRERWLRARLSGQAASAGGTSWAQPCLRPVSIPGPQPCVVVSRPKVEPERFEPMKPRRPAHLPVDEDDPEADDGVPPRRR